jgi:hypothetical protein
VGAAIIIALTASRAGAQAIVRGEIYDSLLTRAPLEGATILVQGTTRTATSDRRGRFVLRDLPAGRYTLGFFHPLLDSLQAGAPLKVVDVGERGTVRVTLVTPSPGTVSLRLCGHAPEPSTSVLFGFVRAAENGAPVDSAEASVRWFELEMEGTGRRQVERDVSTSTREDGLYLLCDVPNDIAVSLVVVRGQQASGALHLGLGAAGIARRDVRVSLTDPASRLVASAIVGDTPPPARVPGLAGLRVVVRNTQGQPVPGAVVGIRGTTASGVANDSGVVMLRAVPAGSQTLAVRAIGLSPSLRVVDLAPGVELAVDVQMDRPATLLPTVSVIGQRPSQVDAEIRLRQQSGWGRYVDGPELRSAASGLAFWAGIPGMSVGRASSDSDAMPMMRIDMNDSCVPDVWLDGLRIGFIDGWELRAMLLNARRMEVFTRAPRVPAQYSTTSGCGAILIWSR